jgi:hypothetical protein
MSSLTKNDNDNANYVRVLKGLDFILGHLQGHTTMEAELFPRKIMTKALGYQKEVYSKEEAMRYFAESDYIDCRIRAYPDQPTSSLANTLGLNQIAPNVIMIDIDPNTLASSLPTYTSISRRLKSVVTKIDQEIDGIPTLLWSGNGYHVIQPIEAPVALENLKELNELHDRPSLEFLRFSEWYLSDGKADSNHYRSLSLGNCLLRIPGSYNGKCVIKNDNVGDESTQVKIIREWNGHRPSIGLLLGSYHVYLVDKRIKGFNRRVYEYDEDRRSVDRELCGPRPSRWIERLLQTPIPDHRKYCLWRILAPYLVNIRRLSDEDALSTVMAWLEKCNAVERLSFYPRYRAEYDIKSARRKGYYPTSLNNLQIENAYIYDLLQEETIS